MDFLLTSQCTLKEEAVWMPVLAIIAAFGHLGQIHTLFLYVLLYASDVGHFIFISGFCYQFHSNTFILPSGSDLHLASHNY